MKIIYGAIGVVAIVLGFLWVRLVAPNQDPITPGYDSQTMQFYEKKAVADLLKRRAEQDGDWESAITAYKDAIAVRPENAEALNNLGAVYYEKGKSLMSLPVEEDLREYSPNPNETLQYIKTKLASVPSTKFVWEIPANVLEPLETYANGRGDILFHLTRIYNGYEVVLYNGETAEMFRLAEMNYLRAINAKSDYGPAFRNLGALYVERGRNEDAAEIFEEALRLEPQDQELRRYLEQLKGY
ncbi:MAG: tetratricopeptide repeat protein [Candidatus Poribacteria bacterium]|nr:tetratricopeptide repeat protein [Candidatus Poribacteria bacterium]